MDTGEEPNAGWAGGTVRGDHWLQGEPLSLGWDLEARDHVSMLPIDCSSTLTWSLDQQGSLQF